MIILVTGDYPIYDKFGNKTDKTEFVVSHGVDDKTLDSVVLPNKAPTDIGAVFNKNIGEWVIHNA